jgi:hypothetical protein
MRGRAACAAQSALRGKGVGLEEGLDFSGPPVACLLYANRALALSEEQCRKKYPLPGYFQCVNQCTHTLWNCPPLGSWLPAICLAIGFLCLIPAIAATSIVCILCNLIVNPILGTWVTVVGIACGLYCINNRTPVSCPPMPF